MQAITISQEQRQQLSRWIGYLGEEFSSIKKILTDNDYKITLIATKESEVYTMFQIPENDKDSQCFIKAKTNNEPTFTLRAKDALAVEVINFWLERLTQEYPESPKVKTTDEVITKFVEWQDTHKSQVKYPD